MKYYSVRLFSTTNFYKYQYDDIKFHKSLVQRCIFFLVVLKILNCFWIIVEPKITLRIHSDFIFKNKTQSHLLMTMYIIRWHLVNWFVAAQIFTIFINNQTFTFVCIYTIPIICYSLTYRPALIFSWNDEIYNFESYIIWISQYFSAKHTTKIFKDKYL